MASLIELTAADGFKLSAYRAEPSGAPRGGIVILQEIFGVNSHIRAVADSFAEEGYLCVAPALFDRVERAVELGYTPDDVATGLDIRARTSPAQAMADVEASIGAVRSAGRIGVVGYCWGGTLAFMAAASQPIDAAVAYYGGQIKAVLDKVPAVPTLLHFGAADASIPLEDVAAIRAACPDAEVHVYEGAGHGFNCDQRGSYHPDHAALARRRTLDFLSLHLAARRVKPAVEA
jgi:carboxymethylenebutenolidase